MQSWSDIGRPNNPRSRQKFEELLAWFESIGVVETDAGAESALGDQSSDAVDDPMLAFLKEEQFLPHRNKFGKAQPLLELAEMAALSAATGGNATASSSMMGASHNRDRGGGGGGSKGGVQKSGELDRRVATGKAIASETVFYGGAAADFDASTAAAVTATLRTTQSAPLLLPPADPSLSSPPKGGLELLVDGGLGAGGGQDGGPKMRRYVTTSKALPLPGKVNKFLAMSEKELEGVIIEESERFKVCAYVGRKGGREGVGR